MRGKSVIVTIYKKGDNTDCSNCRRISLTSNKYILSNILLSRLTQYTKEIIGVYQCGLRRNGSTTGHIFCRRQILEKSGNTMKQRISYL